MSLFAYPAHRHVRSQAPGPFQAYTQYKPFLRLEFERRCVYCRLPDGLRGWEAFGVDHYKPFRRFPWLASVYANLFYSCNVCNQRKGVRWPTAEE